MFAPCGLLEIKLYLFPLISHRCVTQQRRLPLTHSCAGMWRPLHDLCAWLIWGEPLHTTVFIYSAGGKRGSSVLLQSLNIICHAHALGFSLSCTNTDTLQPLTTSLSLFRAVFLMLVCILYIVITKHIQGKTSNEHYNVYS